MTLDSFFTSQVKDLHFVGSLTYNNFFILFRTRHRTYFKTQVVPSDIRIGVNLYSSHNSLYIYKISISFYSKNKNNSLNITIGNALKPEIQFNAETLL